MSFWMYELNYILIILAFFLNQLNCFQQFYMWKLLLGNQTFICIIFVRKSFL